jgi:hypothetical protein
VIVGKVIKVASVDGHDVVTVEFQRTLRGDPPPKNGKEIPQLTFITQKYCSRYAEGWLKEKQSMVFFLVKTEGSKKGDNLPKGFDWVLHEDGNGNSAVLLGETKLVWPGTMDVFTRKFEYLSDPGEIVKYVADYARTLPAARVEKSETIEAPWGTAAYKKVFPPQYPGNAFFLRVPSMEKE